MNFNFSDLTIESQTELFERLASFDAACEWISRFSNLDISTVRITLIGVGQFEGADRTEDDIAQFWADMDKLNSVLP